jgi:hypothetical protein
LTIPLGVFQYESTCPLLYDTGNAGCRRSLWYSVSASGATLRGPATGLWRYHGALRRIWRSISMREPNRLQAKNSPADFKAVLMPGWPF